MADDDELAEIVDLMDIYRSRDLDYADYNEDDLDGGRWEAAPDPKWYSTFALFRAAVGSDDEIDIHDPWQTAYALSSKNKKKLGKAGKKFITTIETWIDDQVGIYFAKITRKKKRYRKKKWKLTAADLKTEWTRIELLEDLYRSMMNSLHAGLAHGSDLLLLANIVWNEAGISSYEAKKAIAYGYLNKKGGTMAPPTGADISGFKPLHDHWRDFDEDQRHEFVVKFAPSLLAAVTRLNDTSPSSNDPTKGATHWVSPQGLEKYDPSNAAHVAKRYSRTYGTWTDMGFPNWARDPSTQEAKDMQTAGTLGPNYDELTIPGVPGEHFLFYTDVP